MRAYNDHAHECFEHNVECLSIPQGRIARGHLVPDQLRGADTRRSECTDLQKRELPNPRLIRASRKRSIGDRPDLSAAWQFRYV